MIEDCDLMVCSADSFLAEAQITLQQLNRLKLDSLFDCYLLLGDKKPSLGGFTVLNRQNPGTWSSEVTEGLLQLKKKYVLLWLDDFIPLKIAPLTDIERLLSWSIKSEANYLRLNPTPRGNGLEHYPGVREILPGSIYRTSTIYSMWHREMLIGLLDKVESAWQFELVGSNRSDRYRGFYASDHTLIHCVNLVVKGLVDPRAERTLVGLGIDVSAVKRRRMNALQLIALKLRETRSRCLEALPWQIRRSLRSRFATNLKAKR